MPSVGGIQKNVEQLRSENPFAKDTWQIIREREILVWQLRNEAENGR